MAAYPTVQRAADWNKRVVDRFRAETNVRAVLRRERLLVVGSTPISGLRREEQLEIGVQQARTRRPDLSGDALLALAKTVHAFFQRCSNPKINICGDEAEMHR